MRIGGNKSAIGTRAGCGRRCFAFIYVQVFQVVDWPIRRAPPLRNMSFSFQWTSADFWILADVGPIRIGSTLRM